MTADRGAALAACRFARFAVVAALGLTPVDLAAAQETATLLSGRVVVDGSSNEAAARRSQVTVTAWPAPTMSWFESALDLASAPGPLQQVVANQATGEFQMSLPAGHRYRLTVEGPGLVPLEMIVLAEARRTVLPEASLTPGRECRFRLVARVDSGPDSRARESEGRSFAALNAVVWVPVPADRFGWRPATQNLPVHRAEVLAVRVTKETDSFVSVPGAASVEVLPAGASASPQCPMALDGLPVRNPPYRIVQKSANSVLAPYIVEVRDTVGNPLSDVRVWLATRPQTEGNQTQKADAMPLLPLVPADFVDAGLNGTVELVVARTDDSEHSVRTEEWAVYAWAPGYVPAGRSLGENRVIKVQLEPATEMVGFVLSDGQTVEGATVNATVVAPFMVAGAAVVRSTSTDHGGAYRVGNVRPGERLLLTAMKAELGTDTASIVAEPFEAGPTRRDLFLSSDFTVRGVVRTASGEALAGAEVAIPNSSVHVGAPSSWPTSGSDGRRARSDIVRTDQEGRFFLRLSRAWTGKRQSLVVAAPGQAVRSIRLPPLLKGKAVVDLGEIVLEPGERIEGTVHDQQGTPVLGALVVWSPSGREASPGLAAYSTLAGAEAQVDGAQFLIDGLRHGETVDLHVSAPSFLPARIPGVRPDTGPIDVVLARGHDLLVRVEDESGNDLQCTVVDLRQSGERGSSGGVRHRCTPGPEQTVAGLAPGTYRVTVGAAGYELAREVVSVNQQAGANEVLVRLESLQAELVGWVSADGGPLSGAGVRVGREHLMTDRLGRFELRARSGRQVIEVEHPATMAVTKRRMNLVRGANEVSFDLSERQFAGQVVDAMGEPVVGVSVSLNSEEILGGFDTTSGGGGFFKLSVQPALYTARFAGRAGELEESVNLRVASLTDRVWRLGGNGRLQIVLHGLAADEDARIQLSRSPLGWGLGGISRRLDGSSDAVFELPLGEWFVKAEALTTGRLGFATVDLGEGTLEAVAEVTFGERQVNGVVRLDGIEAPGVPVFLVAAEGGGLRNLTTGSGGNFSFGGVEPGTWYVSTDTVVREIRVPTGGPVVVDIETGTAMIDVRSATSGGSTEGALLELWPVRVPLNVANRLGAVRRYYSSTEPVVTGRIPVGPYRLRVSGAGGAPTEVLIQVEKPGRRFEVTLSPE